MSVTELAVSRNLANLKREREILRGTLKSLDAEENINKSILTDKTERLFQLDDKIKDELLNQEDVSDEVLEEEFLNVEKFRELCLKMCDRIGGIIVDENDKEEDRMTTFTSVGGRKKVYKLPKIEWMQYDGSLSGWIQFWAQFSKVHTDGEMQEEDKYQYLIQATTGKARTLVESYPPSAGNYLKVIDVLKNRFAKDEMLTEFYIRELMDIVKVQVRGNSSIEISTLYDKLRSNINNLETLGLISDKYAIIILPLVESSLPFNILKEWQRERVKLVQDDRTEGNNLERIMNFLQLEVEAEEKISLAHKDLQFKNSESTAAALVNNNHNYQGNSHIKDKKGAIVECIFCENKHNSQDCRKALKLGLDEKKKIVAEKRACYICLNKNHMAKNCRIFVRCPLCNKRHTLIMCSEFSKQKKDFKDSKQTDEKKQVERVENSKSFLTSGEYVIQQTTTYLQTLMIFILLPNNKKIKVRCLLDSGSSNSFILESLARKLGLKQNGYVSMVHDLFGGVESAELKHIKYNVCVQGIFGKKKYCFDVLGQDRICKGVEKICDENILNKLKAENIFLSDNEAESNSVDILFGTDVLAQIIMGNVKRITDSLTAINTKLGWTVMGKIINGQNRVNFCLMNISVGNLEDYWKLEVLGVNENEKSVGLEEFENKIQVNTDGRYEVKLPFKINPENLGNNFVHAKLRLIALLKKLIQLGKVEDYEKVFEQWVEDDIISKIENDIIEGHYLCHKPVIKESRLTTKVRPVFDASRKTNTGISLNECLFKGPNLVNLIPDILLRFRFGKIGVISDIKQAFLQINIHPEDRKFLKFLWWDKDRRNVITYQHNRVVFGLTSSPFFLASTIQFHLDKVVNEKSNLSVIAQRLKNSFYVDNCTDSVKNVFDLDSFMIQADEVMRKGKFELRSWKHTKIEKHTLDFSHYDCCPSENEVAQVLGLSWDLNADVLKINMKEVSVTGLISKRTLLSVAMSIFDPIGFTSPVTILPKVLLQDAWKAKLNWDESLPIELETKFKNWLDELHNLQNCCLDRYLFHDNWIEASIHVFSDGSKIAYGACAFLRSVSSNGIRVNLIFAKSRIAPIKYISIPRIELLGAQLAAKIYDSICISEDLRKLKVNFWTDSSVVLYWLYQNDLWKPFVSNRVKYILSKSNAMSWKHVSGVNNPADILSRGCNAKELMEQEWWKGPNWLGLDENLWPKENFVYDEIEGLKERRATNCCFVNNESKKFSSCLLKFSKFSSIVRVVGWIFRFYNALKYKKRVIGELNGEEYRIAEKKLLLLIQRENFEDIANLKGLQLVESDDGLYRVKTKLVLGSEEFSFKYPILIPSRCEFTKRLISQVHVDIKHAGVLTTMMVIRENFWIIKCRKTVTEVIRKCILCKRFASKSFKVNPAPLPIERMEAEYPFQHTGVDLAGPLYTADMGKVWLVLFSCAVFRCIHLELVTGLSTVSFLMALRRFMARRGRVEVIFSDNGKNFVGAVNAFSKINWHEVVKEMSCKKIIWKFNAPAAPWWGGFYERMFRIIKDLLKKSLGRDQLNFEELNTITVEIENLVNQRPLTYVSEEEDIVPLTPHLILNNFKEYDASDIDMVDRNKLFKSVLTERVKRLQQIRDNLKLRFKNEYISSLIERKKNVKESQISVGDIVLVESETKRIFWPLAKVVELFKGKDGIVRSAKLKVGKDFILRPLQRVFPLEVNDSTHLTRFKRKD